MDEMTALRIDTPFVTEGLRVLPDWIDVNGHMNLAFYMRVFDQALDDIYARLGLEQAKHPPVNGSVFAAEVHVSYHAELSEGDPLRVTSQLLDADAKRILLFQQLRHATEDYVSASNEWLMLFVDLETRKVATMPDWLQRRLALIRSAHATLPVPATLGRGVRLGNRPAR